MIMDWAGRWSITLNRFTEEIVTPKGIVADLGIFPNIRNYTIWQQSYDSSAAGMVLLR